MIRTFKHRGLKAFHERSDSKLLNQQLVKRIKRILDLLDVAESLEAIDFPGYDLHELKGSRKGTWSVKVSGNWRITFGFESGDAYDVNLEDYH